MFTGIIEEIGLVESISKGSISQKIKISAKKVLADTQIGDSISTNGVCLTVTELGKDSFVADVMAKTLASSNLGELKAGDSVNLERAMQLGKRFGGHIVSGHIDGVATIKAKTKFEIATKIEIKAPKNILKYIIKKGSVAIDGISLTVSELTYESFSVFLIPHTSEETTLLFKNCGETVNIENDVVGKYIERLVNFEKQPAKKDITLDFLSENGFL